MRGNLLITLTFVLSHQRLCQNVILRPFVWLRINSAEESALEAPVKADASLLLSMTSRIAPALL
jgi:hypothetical protein